MKLKFLLIREAGVAELSKTVTACALCGKGHLIKAAAEHLAEKLNIVQTPSATVWLNSISALAACEALTPSLAETVLRPEFLKQFLNK